MHYQAWTRMQTHTQTCMQTLTGHAIMISTVHPNTSGSYLSLQLQQRQVSAHLSLICLPAFFLFMHHHEKRLQFSLQARHFHLTANWMNSIKNRFNTTIYWARNAIYWCMNLFNILAMTNDITSLLPFTFPLLAYYFLLQIQDISGTKVTRLLQDLGA